MVLSIVMRTGQRADAFYIADATTKALRDDEDEKAKAEERSFYHRDEEVNQS